VTSEGTSQEERETGAGEESAPAEPEVVDAEVVEEEPEPEAEAAEAAEADPLADALRERDEYLELARRSRADFENYKRRAASQATEAERRGRSTLAQRLLPALDNLERALTAAGVDPEGTPPEGEPASREVSARDALAEGVALVYRELRSGLERAGVTSYDPVGERFDPVLHEAISTGAADGIEPGTVLETLEQGYRVDEHVIRPARVVVSG
jgi:molecular chaperone GrpE